MEGTGKVCHDEAVRVGHKRVGRMLQPRTVVLIIAALASLGPQSVESSGNLHDGSVVALWKDVRGHVGSPSAPLEQTLARLTQGRFLPPFLPVAEEFAGRGGISQVLWRVCSRALGRQVSMDAASVVLWRHALPLNFGVFGELLEGLVVLTAAGGKSGGRGAPLEQLATHILVIRSLLHLQKAVRKFLDTGRISTRLAEIVRMLPQGMHFLIADGDATLWDTYRRAILGEGDRLGIVYVLWSWTMLYVGKCVLRRKVRPGIASRCGEHLRAVVCPSHPDGKRRRYVELRSAGALAMFFLPILFFPTVTMALAGEAVLIRLFSPSGNETSVTVGRCKGKRNRPPSWVRRKTGGRTVCSVWSLPSVAVKLITGGTARALGSTVDLMFFPGALGAQLGFTMLYRLQQRAVFAASGEFGPIFIFAPERLVLWLSFAASGRRPIPMPRSWSRDEIAEYLYNAVNHLGSLQKVWRRGRARIYIDRLLAALRLPPSRLPPIPIPRVRASRVKRFLSAAIWSATGHLRSPSVVRWLRQGLKFVKAAPIRWTSLMNAAVKCRSFKVQSVMTESTQALAGMLEFRSLRAVDGPWRIPRWPSAKSIATSSVSAWRSWGAAARLTPKLLSIGKRCLKQSFEENLELFPEPPGPWASAETVMFCKLQHVGDDAVIFGDDKKRDRLWFCDSSELHVYTLGQLLSQDAWAPTKMSPATLLSYEIGRAQAALPRFLTRRPLGSNIGPPTLFPLCKSKCFTALGEHVCSKVGHSCMRRVINCSRMPYKYAWRLVSRAIRAVVISVGISQEIADLGALRGVLDSRMEAIAPTKGASACCRVGCGIAIGGTSIVTADIDQAFEACSSTSVLPAWQMICECFRRTTATEHVMVHRSRKVITSFGCKGFGGTTVVFSLEMLSLAMAGYAFLSFALYGDTVWSMQGLPIGGLVSMACLSVVLGVSEYSWRVNRVGQAALGYCFSDVSRHICWLRFVDDVLGISHTLCPSCLLAFLVEAYPAKLSAVSGVGDTLGKPHIWTDVVLEVDGNQDVVVIPKNPNREWLIGKSDCKERVLYTPWLGRPSMPFSVLRACLIGRICRMRALGLNEHWQVYRIAEDLAELACEGYPLHFLRKVVHAIPASRTAHCLRKLVRLWAMNRDRMGKNGPYSSASGGGQQPPRKPSASDKKKEKSRRRRGRSSSSSSSSSADRKRRIAKAQKLLAKEDRNYAAFLVKQESDELRKTATAQAEAFKEALAGAFEGLTRPLGGATPAFPPVPPSGAAAGSVPPPVATGEISKVKARLLEAEFEHEISIINYSVGAVTASLIAITKPPKNEKLVKKFLLRYSDSNLPRTQLGRVEAIMSALESL